MRLLVILRDHVKKQNKPMCICAFFLSKNYTTTQPSDSLCERINKNNIKSKDKAI